MTPPKVVAVDAPYHTEDWGRLDRLVYKAMNLLMKMNDLEMPVDE
jgi:hypothetical protein